MPGSKPRLEPDILVLLLQFGARQSRAHVARIESRPQPATFGDDKSKSLAGFVGGAYLIYHANEWLVFQPELIFSMKGARVTEQAEGYVPVQFDVRLNYIEIPLLARLNLEASGSFQPHVAVGPFYILFHGKRATSGSWSRIRRRM
ncbi:MAG: PorT family protein [Ignavibacteriales bacterium]|nr:PorT family protein [Ignavibacteriales bacterium]